MTPLTGALIGFLVAALLIGVAIAVYFLVSSFNRLSAAIVSMKPFFGDDLLASIRTFRVIAEQGFEMCKKIDTLNETIKAFHRFAMVGKSPIADVETEDTPAVFGYSEEMAAVREAAMKSQSKKTEATDETGAVYPPVSDTGDGSAVY
jgi:hypothetical protein